MSFTSINPTTNETLQTFETLSSSQLTERIDLAHQAFAAWRLTPFAERAKKILKFAALLRQRSAELAQLITREMGKRISESKYEIEYCAKISEFYAHGAEKFLADEPLHIDGIQAYIHPCPLGVILGVMPWNFPFYQVVRFATPNIMAGNTVLIKHASNVPQCAQEIERLFAKCGLPDGVYGNLFLPTPLVENAIADSRVRGVSLTGSERAGAAVAEAAGKNIKRSVLELGGNDPLLRTSNEVVEWLSRLNQAWSF